jgi:hypothetical protein
VIASGWAVSSYIWDTPHFVFPIALIYKEGAGVLSIMPGGREEVDRQTVTLQIKFLATLPSTEKIEFESAVGDGSRHLSKHCMTKR